MQDCPSLSLELKAVLAAVSGRRDCFLQDPEDNIVLLKTKRCVCSSGELLDAMSVLF